MLCAPCASIDPLEQGQEDEDAENGEKPRVLRDPALPTQKEREEYEATHLPFRSWCPHCVRGAARDAQSKKISAEMSYSSIPRVYLDYCLFTEDSKSDKGEAERTTMTTLVMKETECKSVWAYPVANKGAANEPWVAQQVIYDIETVGIHGERIVIKQRPGTSHKGPQGRHCKAKTGSDRDRQVEGRRLEQQCDDRGSSPRGRKHDKDAQIKLGNEVARQDPARPSNSTMVDKACRGKHYQIQDQSFRKNGISADEGI